LRTKTINFRLAVICLAAASIGLSISIISIAKLLLLCSALALLLFTRTPPGNGVPLAKTWTMPAVIVALLAFVLSLLWTVAPQEVALASIAKYGKLILILVMMALIRDRREAMYALGAFAIAQLLVVLSSWLLFVHVPVPWASSRTSLTHYTVFSGYLDQGIMSAVFAALCFTWPCARPLRSTDRDRGSAGLAGQCVFCACRAQRSIGWRRADIPCHHVALAKKISHRRRGAAFFAGGRPVFQLAHHAGEIDATENQEYLYWGVQLGIPGLLLFAAFILSVLRDSLKMEAPYARAVQSAVLALAVACLFNSTLYDGLIGDFFCILIGLLLALGLSKPASPPPFERAT
jgi:hypothetical protein